MSRRGITLIVAAICLAAGLLGVQLASGGGDFAPQRAADPCEDRATTVPVDVEGVGEAVVLAGLDDAACKLGVTRERLVLALPSEAARAELAREAGTDERGLTQAIDDGLRSGVDRLEASGQLPGWSALMPSIAEQLGISQGLAGLIPDSLLESLPSTAAVLRHSLDNVDMATVLAGLDDRQSLEATLREAVIRGAIDAVRESIADALPGPLRGLLG
jgi:hypothetical protein